MTDTFIPAKTKKETGFISEFYEHKNSESSGGGTTTLFNFNYYNGIKTTNRWLIQEQFKRILVEQLISFHQKRGNTAFLNDIFKQDDSGWKD